MKFWKLTLAGGVLALALMLVTGNLATAQTAAPAPAPTKIAVVNIVRMFSNLEEKKTNDNEIEVIARQLDTQRKTLEGDIENLKKEIKAYADGSDAQRDAQERLFKKAMELDSHMRYMEQKLMMEQRIRTVAVYRKMDKAIADFAKGNGIAIVFVSDDVDFAGAKSPGDVIGKITLRKVVYAHDTLDITQPLINKMNVEYKGTAASNPR